MSECTAEWVLLTGSLLCLGLVIYLYGKLIIADITMKNLFALYLIKGQQVESLVDGLLKLDPNIEVKIGTTGKLEIVRENIDVKE